MLLYVDSCTIFSDCVRKEKTFIYLISNQDYSVSDLLPHQNNGEFDVFFHFAYFSQKYYQVFVSLSESSSVYIFIKPYFWIIQRILEELLKSANSCLKSLGTEFIYDFYAIFLFTRVPYINYCGYNYVVFTGKAKLNRFSVGKEFTHSLLFYISFNPPDSIERSTPFLFFPLSPPIIAQTEKRKAPTFQSGMPLCI